VLSLSIAQDFEEVVFSCRVAFSKRSWPYVLGMAIPWLLCSGQRVVTRLAAFRTHSRHIASYYRFLSDGRWYLDRLRHCLFQLVVRSFRLQQLTLVLDDTLCPKWGRRIYGTAWHYDHAARPRPGHIWGHNWVVLAIVVPCGPSAAIALPFWIGLYPPRKHCPEADFRTRHQMAVAILQEVRTWFPGPIELVADGAYANRSLVGPARELGFHVVSRIRKDARLRHPTPPRRRPGQRGRPPKWGPWFPALPRLARNRRSFRSARVTIYGRQVELLLRDFVAFWPALGLPVKIVISRDPRRPRRLAYLWTTDLDKSAEQIVEAFARRWTIEQLFAVAKQQMGLDSAELRTENSVRRHAAFCMAMITWLEVWAQRRKPGLRGSSFARKLAAVRVAAIENCVFHSGPRTQGVRRKARHLAQILSTATRCA